MRKKTSLSHIVLLLLLAAAVLFASSCSFTVTVTVDTEPEDTAPVETAPAETTPAETQAYHDDTLDGCLFIGDSRTEGLRKAGSLAEADFFCTVGQTVFDITSVQLPFGYSVCDLGQVLSGREYRKVYILLGINEISADFDTIVDEFSGLIDFILAYQPGAKIIIQANLHVTTARSYMGDSVNNENVDRLNRKLKTLTDGTAICWLDANPILDDESGGLSEVYAEADGIHPNFECYAMWGEWIDGQNGYY